MRLLSYFTLQTVYGDEAKFGGGRYPFLRFRILANSINRENYT